MNAPPLADELTTGEGSASETDAKKDHESGERIDKISIALHQSGSGIVPRGAPDEAAPAASPAPAGLPCQNSNNSNKPTKRYRLKRIPGSADFFTSKDCTRAIWQQVDGDTISRWGMPSGAEAKSAFHLRLNIASFVGKRHSETSL